MYHSTPGSLYPQGPLHLTETAVRAYLGGVDALNRFWYANDKHGIDTAYLRGLLGQDPSANQCLWGKLHLAEGLCLVNMYNTEKLGEWVPGMTLHK